MPLKGNPDATTTDRCNYCNEKVGKSNLKKCSQCRFVKYCSRDCQKAAWPTHKQSCLVAVDFHKTIKERGNEEFVIAFNKWLDCWRGTFFDMALSAMDLANHPPDRLATHTILILLARNEPRPAERVRWFRMTAGEVLSREECVTAFRDFGMTEEHIEEWKRDARGECTVQLNLMCEEHTRMLWFSKSDREGLRSVDKATSASLAASWEQAMIAKIDRGYPGMQNDIVWTDDEEDDD